MSLVKRTLNPAVKHVIRQLSAINPPIGSGMGYATPDKVDAEIGNMLLQGYRIVNTHFLGKQIDPSNGAEYFGILYVMQLEQSEIERMRQDFKASVEQITGKSAKDE